MIFDVVEVFGRPSQAYFELSQLFSLSGSCLDDSNRNSSWFLRRFPPGVLPFWLQQLVFHFCARRVFSFLPRWPWRNQSVARSSGMAQHRHGKGGGLVSRARRSQKRSMTIRTMRQGLGSPGHAVVMAAMWQTAGLHNVGCGLAWLLGDHAEPPKTAWTD